MSEFIYQIGSFVWNLIYNFYISISFYINRGYANNAQRIGLTVDGLTAVLDKQIINGELISIGLTWRELIIYVIPITLIVLFIIFIFKLVGKVIGLIRI